MHAFFICVLSFCRNITSVHILHYVLVPQNVGSFTSEYPVDFEGWFELRNEYVQMAEYSEHATWSVGVEHRAHMLTRIFAPETPPFFHLPVKIAPANFTECSCWHQCVAAASDTIQGTAA